MNLVEAQNEANASKIDWTIFNNQDSRFIRLEAGIPKKLRLESVNQTVREFNLQDGTTERRDALDIRITQEDDQNVEKQLTVTSKRLALALKPHIIKGLPTVLTISKIGEKFNTQYKVEEG